MAQSELTMCLYNYARSEQMHQIISELKKQSCRPKIVIWNNDVTQDFVDDRADWVINSSINAHTGCIGMLWQNASTKYVGSMDDDLHFVDDDILGDVLPVLEGQRHDRKMVGAFGVRLYIGETYRESQHINATKGQGQKDKEGNPRKKRINMEVDLLKGRIMLAKQSASHFLSADYGHNDTDLYVSTTLAGRHRYFHTVAGDFWDRMIDFPIDDKGYCERVDHYERRDAICQAWAASCLPSRKVKVRKRSTKEKLEGD